MSRTEKLSTDAVPIKRRANGWPVLPMRLFLAALFMFAGYAKLSYPGFFDPNSPGGLKSSVDAVKHGTPIGAALGPLSHHPSLFGHITAYAEIAIGLGLLVGLLTRIAALGGIVLTLMIALSINWSGIKQYTGSSGWFTSVDFAVAAALSVFLLGGADPFSLDAVIGRARARRLARDDNEPGFRDNEFEESRRRLQGEPNSYREPAASDQVAADNHALDSQHRTQQLPHLPEDDPDSLWNSGRPEPVTGPGAAADRSAQGRAASRVESDRGEPPVER